MVSILKTKQLLESIGMNKIVQDYRNIKDDYAFNAEAEEPDKIYKIKEIVNTRLSQADKTIIILYCEYQSYRKLGQKLGVSHMTMRREIQRIRNIIIAEYEKIKDL